MLQINNNPNSVFCAPPPGKPNSNEPRIQGRLRSRIVRHSQKGDTCLYSALQILRDEAKPPKSDRSQAEKLLSRHKKTLNKWTDKWGPIEKTVSEIYESGLNCTREKAPLLIQASKEHKELSEEAQRFMNQKVHDDLELYISAAKKEELEKIHRKLFIDLGYTQNQVDDFFQSTLPTHHHMSCNPDKYFSDLPKHEQAEKLLTLNHLRATMMHGFYCRVAKEIYGLEFSSWNPEKPISELIEQLKLHGPLLVNSGIGKSLYATPPRRLNDQIEGRTIWGWTPNSERIEGNGSHAIVIVGAEEVNNRGYVYFLDPLTESRDLNSQEIFKVSYSRFLSTIFDLRQRNDVLRKEFAQQKLSNQTPFFNEYALFCPKSF